MKLFNELKGKTIESVHIDQDIEDVYEDLIKRIASLENMVMDIKDSITKMKES